MAFASLCSADLRNILPISAIEITGKQNDMLAQLHVVITYSNTSLIPIPITYSPPIENIYGVEKVTASSGGVSLGPVDKPEYRPQVTKSNSMELGLLDDQDSIVARLGVVKPNDKCQLVFDCSVRSRMTYSDICSTSLKLTAPSLGQSTDIREAFLPGVRFSVKLEIFLSNSIVEVTSNMGSTNFEATSSSSGLLQINSVPVSNALDISMKLTTVAMDFNRDRPRAPSDARVFTFSPILPGEACRKLVDARNASVITEKACLLAQAAHGYQLSNEEFITQIVCTQYPSYDGDLLTLSKNTGTEAITAIQPSAWINDRYDTVFSIYEGDYINNYVNKWDGRTFTKMVIHNLLLGVHSIICFVLLVFSIVLWGLMKRAALSIFFGMIVIAYLIVNLIYIFKGRSLFARQLNDTICYRVRESLGQFRAAIPPGYIDASSSYVITAGIFWREMFFEPGFDVLLRLITSLSRNPTDPIYSNPMCFRSLMLLHRYIVPLIFAFNDEVKMAQFDLIVKCFRKVVTNALLQGSEEVKNMLEQAICDAFEDENIRCDRPLNLRHFTLDTPGIIELFKSIANAAAGRNGERGEVIRAQLERLNEAIRRAEANGVIEEMKQNVTQTPYLQFFL